MPRTTAPDPALVERIRGLLGGPGSAQVPSEVHEREPGWVPGPPGDPPPPRILTVPTFLREARLRVGRRALAATSVLVLSAATLFALRVAVAIRQGEPVAVTADRSALVGRSVPPGFTAVAVPTSAGGELSTSAQAPTGPASSAGGGGPPTVLVHVVGEVASPGVVTLGAGSRVAEAVAAKAGGALPAADLNRVNLARVVVDGEQVHVPAPGEPLPASEGIGGSAGAAGGSAPSGDGHQLVNLNTADVAALDTLPGVGPVLAQRIVQWRQEHGSFTSVAELNEVSGIGDKLFAQLRTRVTV